VQPSERFNENHLRWFLVWDLYGSICRRLTRTAAAASFGEGAAIATLGFFVLTLVPLARIGFCFILFLKQRSIVFAAFTA
jgi:hypothetical protein